MKTLKQLTVCTLALVMINCTKDDNNLDYLNNVQAPSNVSALFQVTQDNTGLVTIIPNSEGAVSYNIDFGDSSEPQNVLQGKNVQHTYAEGSYSVGIEAVGITGLKSETTENLEVSFKAPENLEVIIENDMAISKQVNVTVTADFAINYDVYFGEPGNDTAVTGNIGSTVSYVYAEAGTYTIRIVVKGAAIETTEYIEEFEVTAILQPIASAPTPPARGAQNVISLYTSAYDNVPGTDFFPDWGQGGCCGSSWTTFDLNGDQMLQYINLSYQGNQFAGPIDVSGMEYFHMDVWTSGDVSNIETSLISLTNGEKPVVSALTPNGWTSLDIPISAWTDQGLTVADIHQIKYVGDPWAAGTVFIDNIYFWKNPAPASGVEGVWVLAPEAGALGVGPAPGDTSWWNCDGACVAARACYYDDTYVFAPDGSFYNVLGGETWVEGWQGGSDACGAPVAPHDGSANATYVYDDTVGTITLNGAGAYIGLPKAVNTGELPNVPVPSSITYNVTLTDNNNTMNVVIESGTGVFWQYKLIRYNSPLEGTWVLAPEGGALGVGPAPGDTSWWNCDAACVTTRACYYDDAYVFGSDGSFTNLLGTETWIEGWQGGSDSCGTPVAPHDGMGSASFVYDEVVGTVTIHGTGSYIGLPKAVNAGELPNVPVPDSITYSVTFLDSNTISVVIEAGTGVFWQYKLVRQ